MQLDYFAVCFEGVLENLPSCRTGTISSRATKENLKGRGRNAPQSLGIPGPLLPNNVSLVTPPSPSLFHPSPLTALLSLARRRDPQHLPPPPHCQSPSNPWSGAALAPLPPAASPALREPAPWSSVLPPAARGLPLQPPTQELSSPPQLNEPPNSRVSSLSFVCARAELGRREKGEVALSVRLPLALPRLLQVPLGRQEPRGGCG